MIVYDIREHNCDSGKTGIGPFSSVNSVAWYVESPVNVLDWHAGQMQTGVGGKMLTKPEGFNELPLSQQIHRRSPISYLVP